MAYKFQSKALSNKIEILNDEVLIGTIQFNNWRSEVNVEINGKQYSFKKKSFWKKDLDLINHDSQEIVAEIIFDSWKSKVSLNLSATDIYTFNHQDFWRKSWVILGENLQKIEFLNRVCGLSTLSPLSRQKLVA